MEIEESKYWLAFSAFPGIGPMRFKLLLEYFGSAKKAWEANEKELKEIGLGEKLVAAFLDFRKEFSIDDYVGTLKKKEIQVVTWEDAAYPKRLKEIPDAPFLLYVKGDAGELGDMRECVAVVGTRRMTSYGREATKRIVEGLVSAGVTIVSGMAYGIDTVAHEIAIASGGKTIAVLGCGVDVIHPKANTTLYWKIIKGAGCVISEFPVGQYAAKGLFPARNRIISGLSLGTIVIEGASDSGSLITARYAAEQGRDVFAVPGPITSDMSAATNILLKQGAKLVTSAEDVLEELNIKNQRSKIKNIHQKLNISLTKEEDIIYQLIVTESLHFDDIVRRSKLITSQVGMLLTTMEMKGIIKNQGSGMYGI